MVRGGRDPCQAGYVPEGAAVFRLSKSELWNLMVAPGPRSPRFKPRPCPRFPDDPGSAVRLLCTSDKMGTLTFFPAVRRQAPADGREVCRAQHDTDKGAGRPHPACKASRGRLFLLQGLSPTSALQTGSAHQCQAQGPSWSLISQGLVPITQVRKLRL